MTTRQSAGILLFRRTGTRLEVLLAHPGGPLFARRDEASWTIPKGVPNGETDLLVVARREFAEETGHEVEAVATHPSAEPIPLGSVVQRSGKTVHAWAVEGDLEPALAHSNSFEMVWPPRSGRTITVPEIDRVEWFEPEAARAKVNPAQAALVDRLIAALEAR